MKPGPEIDALVAEKVMGWDISHLEIEHIPGRGPVVIAGSKERWPKGCPLVNEDLRPYSTDGGAAWEVVEKLVKEKGDLALCVQVFPSQHSRWKRYTINLSGTGEVLDGRGDIIQADSLPYAICLAALKAVGVHGLSEQ